MAIDTTSPTTRRALLFGAAGALVAAVAGTFARAQPVAAHDGDDVQIEVINSTMDTTTVWNKAADGSAFEGDATGSGTGIQGQSESGTGVLGISSTGTGVEGIGQDLYGVWGSSTSNYGVLGDSTSSTGVFGRTFKPSESGVYGYSDFGRGGRFYGKKAQVRLDPSALATHPASGLAGDLFVDGAHRLWFCKGGSTWVKLA
jgi:hypothetical protein